ncbi:HHR207Cp [Eremothecium sinecaudum]|uniref:HHR207Cp n=1 Tax=Eremothecium sinecaudum TaxID=45286 RepID=A0A0X8HWG3_9SACH|nr:HHR207Cp [Eremothecium sinecaudum]AMD22976.1 HHR207Cp [Eremothecium sinecaudum]
MTTSTFDSAHEEHEIRASNNMKPLSRHISDFSNDLEATDGKTRRRIQKVVELLEIDGKRVSKTATGKRKFHNKSKNGCDNCKRRRVKCDEGKPSCQKCLKMNLGCTYTPAKPRKKKNEDMETVIKYVTARGEAKDASDKDIEAESNDMSSVVTHSEGRTDTAINPCSPNTTSDSTLLPHLFIASSTQQLQQQLQMQPHLLPQLMTLSGSDKFNAFDLSSCPTPIQAANMNVSNSIGTFFSNSKVTSTLLQQIAQSPGQLDLSSSLSKSLKQNNNTIALNNIGNVQYDYPELLSVKQLCTKDQSTLSNSICGASVSHSTTSGSEHKERLARREEASSRSSESSNGDITSPSASCSSLPPMQVQPNDMHDGAQKQSNQAAAQAGQRQHQLVPPSTQESLPQVRRRLPRHSSSEKNHNGVGVLTALNSGPGAQGLLNNPTIAPLPPPMSPITQNGATSCNLINNPTITPLPPPMSPIGKAATKGNLNNLAATVPPVSASVLATGIGNRECNSDSNNPNKRGRTNSMEGEELPTTAFINLPSFANIIEFSQHSTLNLVDVKLFHHYCKNVWPTIISAGISEQHIWSGEIPELAFQYPFLMHALLAFSATHLSRSEAGLEPFVSSHRLESLKLLREAVLQICEENTDALVASALILIMDSLANAAPPNQTSMSSDTMLPSAWIFHVKGAATILTAVWPLTPSSRFYNLINVDLSDLGDVINSENGTISDLVCFDDSIADLYPVEIDSPYLITLAYLDKLHREKDRSGFMLRVFAFPALLDKTFLALLMTGDLGAMRIMRSYYTLLHSYATEVKDRVWFLEGMSQALPQDVDEYSGGGMHMMLDFLGGGLPSMTTMNFTELV